MDTDAEFHRSSSLPPKGGKQQRETSEFALRQLLYHLQGDANTLSKSSNYFILIGET